MNKQSLAQRYRPQTFSDVVGQRAATSVLRAMVQREALPSGLLFSGPRGTGKTSMGRLVAAALNCLADDDRPCGTCASCLAVQQGTSLSVQEIDGATHGTVAEIRKLKEQVTLAVGGHLVVLLDEAQAMSREANSALLSLLEEPPPDVTFILLTTEPGKILDTVVSRLVQLPFSRISTSDLLARLNYVCDREGFELDRRLLVPIAERSHGALRDALMQLDQVTRAGIETLEAFTGLFGEPDIGPLLLAEVLTGDVARVARAVEAALLRTGDAGVLVDAMVTTLRDVMVLLTDEHALDGHSATARAARASLGKELGVPGCFRALQLLWELQRNTIAGRDPRALLDLGSILLVDALNAGNLSKPQVSQPAARVSLAELS